MLPLRHMKPNSITVQLLLMLHFRAAQHSRRNALSTLFHIQELKQRKAVNLRHVETAFKGADSLFPESFAQCNNTLNHGS